MGTINKDFFEHRDSNRDFQEHGAPAQGWSEASKTGTLVPTHCCFCGVQCGMNLEVKDGAVVGISPRNYTHNQGSLCPKGVLVYQQVGHPERLLHPMIRRGGKGGRLERASWDEALDHVAGKWKDLQARHGPDSIAVYSGSSMTNEKCYLAGKFGRVALGTRHVAHPDGRARMFATPYAPPAEEPGGGYPFRLTTGRVVYHYLSGTQTRRLPFLNDQAPEPWVEIHPDAAERLGIASGERVRVRTPRASMELKALVTPTIRPDTLFIPFHYGHLHAVNQLTSSASDPTVKIPEYKACAATVERAGSPEGPLAPPVRNFDAKGTPEMFPYASGEGRSPEEEEKKTY